MATIARLVVALGADPSEFRSQLVRSTTFLKQFASDMSRVTQRTRLFGNLDTQGKIAAQQLFTGFQSAFAGRLARARQALEAGAIDPAEFERRARFAGQRFNEGLISTIQTLRSRRILTPDIEAALTGQFVKAGRKAGIAFTEQFQQTTQTMQQVGRSLTIGVTLPVVAIGTAAIKAGANFEQAMNTVQAITGATTRQIQGLSDTARALGRGNEGFGFSAVQAAEAMEVLARAGLSANNIMQATPGVMELAAAAEIDLAKASDFATRIIAGFGLTFADLPRVIDVLAKTANDSQVSIEEVGNSFSYAASIASVAGQNFEDVAAAIGVLGNAGIRGSRAGTTLIGILTHLLDPSKEAAEALKRLGIDATDGAGHLKSIIDVVRDFERQGAKAGDFLQIFAQRAGPGLAALVGQGSAALLEMRDHLNDAAGTAATVAEARLRGLNGQLKLLKAAFVELGLAISESGLLDGIRSIVVAITGMIRNIAQADPFWIRFAAGIAVGAAAIGPLLIGLAKLRVVMTIATGATALLTSEVALGGLAAMLGTGGVLIVGLGLLAALFFKAGDEARIAAAKTADYRIELAKLSDVQIGQEQDKLTRDLEQALRERQALLKRAQQTRASQFEDAGLGGGFVPTEAGAELERNLEKIRALAAKFAALKQQIQDRADAAAQTALDLQKIKKQIEDLDASARLAAASVGDEDSLKGIRKAAEAAIQRLEFVEEATKGVEDRSRRLAAPLEEVRRQWAAIGETIQRQGVMNVDPALLGIFDSLQQAMNEALKPDLTGFENLKAAIDENIARIKALSAETAAFKVGAGDMAQPVAALAENFLAVSRMIEAQGGPLRANTALIEAQNAALARLVEVPDTQIGVVIGQLGQAASAYAEAQQQFLIALASGDQFLIAGAQQAVTQLSQRVAGLNALLQRRADAKLKINTEIVVDTKGLEDEMARVQQSLLDTLNPANKLYRTLGLIADAGRSMIQLADSFNVLGDNIRRAVDGAFSLIGALKQVHDAKNALNEKGEKVVDAAGLATGVLGAITAGAAILSGVLSGLFGQSEASRMRDEVLKENSQRLAELKSSLDQRIATADASARAGAAAAALFANNVAFAARSLQFIVGNTAGIKLLDEQLRAFGLTFEQLQQIAKQNGIQLLDEKGRIVAEAFDQLATAMGITLEQLTTFGNTFEDQQRRLELRDALGLGNTAISGTTADLARNLELLNSLAPELGKSFEGLDASTEQGRAAILEGLRNLFKMMENNTFLRHPELLGNLTFEQLQQIVKDSADALNTFKDATEEATRSMLNVPSGFKIAAARWFAELPTAPIDATGTGNRSIDVMNPRHPTVEVPSVMTVGAEPQGSITFNVQPGAIVVTADPRNPDAQARQMLEGLRRLAQRRTGRTVNLGGL